MSTRKNKQLGYVSCNTQGIPLVAQLVENVPANAGDAGDAGSNHGSGRSPGEGNGNPLQYSCWKIPWTKEPGVVKSQI